MLQNIYEMACESKIMPEVEVRALNGTWKETDKVHDPFVKVTMVTNNCSQYYGRNGTWQRMETLQE
jgi:hypothetical protein